MGSKKAWAASDTKQGGELLSELSRIFLPLETEHSLGLLQFLLFFHFCTHPSLATNSEKLCT